MIIYLAGPIAGMTDEEAGGWRIDAERAFANFKGFKTLNPFRDRDYRNRRDYDPAEVVEPDKAAIRQSDIVLVNWYKGGGTGTTMEVIYAWEQGKKVVVMFDGDPQTLSPWLRYHAFKVLRNLNEAVQYILILAEAK